MEFASNSVTSALESRWHGDPWHQLHADKPAYPGTERRNHNLIRWLANISAQERSGDSAFGGACLTRTESVNSSATASMSTWSWRWP
jgi:hypothetical protein